MVWVAVSNIYNYRYLTNSFFSNVQAFEIHKGSQWKN